LPLIRTNKSQQLFVVIPGVARAVCERNPESSFCSAGLMVNGAGAALE